MIKIQEVHIDLTVLLELQHPLQDVAVALSHQVFVVLPGVPGIAGVETDPPETFSRNHRPHLFHVVDEDLVEILVMTPGHDNILYPTVLGVHPVLSVVPLKD